MLLWSGQFRNKIRPIAGILWVGQQSYINYFMFNNNYTQQEYKSYHVIIAADGAKGTGELLLGDLNAATDDLLMREHNVKTIITAATGLEHLKFPPEQTHVVFPLLDLKTENIETYFELSYQTIETNLKRGAVLVHCGAGISRSATLVIAYYMKKYEEQFSNALKYVRKIRPNICPNLGFELQLKKYQEQLHSTHGKKTMVEKSKEGQHDNKKHHVEAKQMNLTFNAPTVQNKSARMANTNTKNFVAHTPVSHRKNSHHSSNKKNVVEEKDLFIVGRQPAEMKNQSMYEVEKYWQKSNGSWGQKRRQNDSFKL